MPACQPHPQLIHPSLTAKLERKARAGDGFTAAQRAEAKHSVSLPPAPLRDAIWQA